MAGLSSGVGLEQAWRVKVCFCCLGQPVLRLQLRAGHVGKSEVRSVVPAQWGLLRPLVLPCGERGQQEWPQASVRGWVLGLQVTQAHLWPSRTAEELSLPATATLWRPWPHGASPESCPGLPSLPRCQATLGLLLCSGRTSQPGLSALPHGSSQAAQLQYTHTCLPGATFCVT